MRTVVRAVFHPTRRLATELGLWDGRRLDEWSDIDLLVVLDTYEPRDAINLKTRAFKGSTSSAPFDVSFSDPDRYVGRSQIPGTVERATVLDGRCVYRRD